MPCQRLTRMMKYRRISSSTIAPCHGVPMRSVRSMVMRTSHSSGVFSQSIRKKKYTETLILIIFKQGTKHHGCMLGISLVGNTNYVIILLHNSENIILNTNLQTICPIWNLNDYSFLNLGSICKQPILTSPPKILALGRMSNN